MKAGRILVWVACVAFAVAACDAYDCTQHSCDEYGSGSNGNTFSSCCACSGAGGASIQLRDPNGNVFYQCSDNDGTTCSTDPNYDSAIQAYCGL